jgi:hypothetical protein
MFTIQKPAPIRLKPKPPPPVSKQRGKRTPTCGALQPYEITARSVTLGAFFYCSLNWVYYRNIRKLHEKENENEKEKDERDQ